MAKKKNEVVALAGSGMRSVKLIRLPNPYNGFPSNLRVIPAGDYREDSPELLGLGGYLVETNHARVIDEVLVSDVVEIVEFDDEESEEDSPPPPDGAPAI